MHVALLFPAATDPRSPHLALPSLAAALRPRGIRVTLRDLDLEGLLHLVEPERLAAAADRLRRRLDAASPDERPALARLLALAPAVVSGATEALDTLRGDGFYDPQRQHQARLCLATALRITSAASGRVRYDISNAAYEVDGIDPSRLTHLEAVTADPDANLFEELYQTRVLPDLAADRPDVVGISILNRQQIIPGLRLARLCREAGHFVVIGGTVYAKFAPQLATRPRFLELFADVVVPYEGESALAAIVEARAAGRSTLGLPNTVALDDDRQVCSGPVVVEDVPCLPTPDFDGLPLDEYLAPEPVLPILTGKGCYFNRCKFCDIPAINAVSPRAYRVRKPEQIVADVLALWDRHGARHFEITDEALSPALLKRFADALDVARAERPDFDPRFVGYARLERGFTRAVCERLVQAGFRKLFFGLESGSQAMLDHMDKGVDVPEAHEVLRNCAAAGLAVHVFTIVGFPEETEDQARETLQFLLDAAEPLTAPANTFDVHPFGLDLRTEYGDQAPRFGIEVDHDDLGARDFPISIRSWRNTRGLSAAEAGALIEEFAGVLRRRFRATRNYPDQLWPGFEEYALLYGSRYEGRSFPWRLSLPDPGDEVPFRLVWADHVRLEPAAPDDPASPWRVTTFDGDLEVPAALLALLDRPRPARDVDSWFAEVLDEGGVDADERGAVAGQLRHAVDLLLAIRALWHEPVVGEGAPASEAVPAGAAS